MKIKTFPVDNYDEATKFIESVVLQDSGVQITDSHIVVSYYETKENYANAFVEQMREGLKKNLFHENIRKLVNDADYEYRKEKGTNQKGFDEAQNRQKETEENIKLFEVKLKALEGWKANNS